MGYLILNEYTPSLVSETAMTPDITAVKTPQFKEILNKLSSVGITSAGAFAQELALFGSFRKMNPTHALGEVLTRAEIIVLEVERRSHVKQGSRQLADYSRQAYGFYGEGYLVAPFINGEGVISLDYDGRLVFSRDKTVHYTSPLPQTWREKKKLQLLDVRGNVILQLLKNLQPQQMIEICGGKDIRTYLDLERAWVTLDIENVIDALLSL